MYLILNKCFATALLSKQSKGLQLCVEILHKGLQL